MSAVGSAGLGGSLGVRPGVPRAAAGNRRRVARGEPLPLSSGGAVTVGSCRASPSFPQPPAPWQRPALSGAGEPGETTTAPTRLIFETS